VPIVKVATTDASTFTITSTGTVKSLHPGDTVAITGATGTDGTITATAVRDLGASGTGGFVGRSPTAAAGAPAGGGFGGPPGG